MSVLPGAGVERLLVDLDRRVGTGLEVLEAGCGRFRHFAYPEGTRIAGLDISPDQLALNTVVHEKFVGDVQTWQTPRQWDAVVSIFVLEHLDDPGRAVANMLRWTRPGGLLVLAVPNALSLKGLVTRATPFGFHHWFYRHVYRRPYAIFPTTMRLCIAPRRLRRQLAGHRVVLEAFGQECFAAPFNLVYGAVTGLLKILSLGRWRPEDSNYLLVVERAKEADHGPKP